MNQVALQTTDALLVGVGNFGYALLAHLERHAGKDWRLAAWDADRSVTESLRTRGRHPRLHEERALGGRVSIPSLAEIAAPDVLILAVDSDAVRDALTSVAPRLERPVLVLNTAKALAPEGCPLSAVVTETLGASMRGYAVLAGGLTAYDVLRGQSLGATLACADAGDSGLLQELLGVERLALDPSADVRGVEVAAAFGNVVAVLAGITDGAGLPAGTQARLVTRVAGELAELAVRRFGASPETFGSKSLCWVGEIYLAGAATTPGREFGSLLGRGFTVADALSALSRANRNVEGFRTIRALGRVPEVSNLPCTSALFDFVVGVSDRADLLRELCRARG